MSPDKLSFLAGVVCLCLALIGAGLHASLLKAFPGRASLFSGFTTGLMLMGLCLMFGALVISN
jgi:hypothetical protein